MPNTASITEIFSSIQGEGPYIGCKQIFVRFSGCNLICSYCDTDHSAVKTYTAQELLEEISCINQTQHHSISFTGGEPLLQADFLKEIFPELSGIKVYLETNGTLPIELEKIITYTDIIAMDIKLESSTGASMPVCEHEEFIRIARAFNKEIFVKLVVSKNINEDEIMAVGRLLKDDIMLILQPVYEEKDVEALVKVQEKMMKRIKDVRIIPQTHKYMGIR